MIVNLTVDPAFHMWFVLVLTVLAVVAFVREKLPLEISSVVILSLLLLLGQFFPLPGAEGQNLLDAAPLMAGFANPSLIAVMALLVMGQGIVQTDALRLVTSMFMVRSKGMTMISIGFFLIFVAVVSAFMNDTPLVVIAIPLMQALASIAKVPISRVMIPLSYAAVLGGMTTLIGSSTNLLVASAMTNLGYQSPGFFDFIIPGMMLAGVGLVYVIFIVPRLLPDRTSMVKDLAGNEKEFVAELDIAPDSKLIGAECHEGSFQGLSDLKVKLIQRGGHLILPPFEGYKIEAGDILIVAATRQTLAELLSRFPGFLLSEEEAELIEQKEKQKEEEESSVSESSGVEPRLLAEIMITPASRMIDMSLEHANFERQFGVIVLGIQRRARVVRRRLGRIRLEPGDVLLVAGLRSIIDSMRNNSDFIVLSGSKKEIPVAAKAPLAAGIFIFVVALAASGILPIPVAALSGCVLMILTGCLNIQQATRALDRKIFLLVGSMLAVGTALEVTGGAEFLANLMFKLPYTDVPLVAVSVLFLLVAIATNILTNNACAILFTPIAMSLADLLSQNPALAGMDMHFILAVTVIFGANCSFASPIGYQTNLLVMGPGHYRFRDFVKAGLPLVLILWGVYILIAKFYYGL